MAGDERRRRLARRPRRRDARRARSRPARSDRTPGTLFGPVPRILWRTLVERRDRPENRAHQALNCLLVETPAGRVLVETGIGERMDDKTRACAAYTGDADRAGAAQGGLRPGDGRRRRDEPPPFRPCRRAAARPTARGRSRARAIVAQRAEWEIALGDNPRLVASLRPAGAAPRRATGAREGCGGRRARGAARRVGGPHRRPLRRPPGDRRPWRRTRDASASSATCACGRGAPTRAG